MRNPFTSPTGHDANLERSAPPHATEVLLDAQALANLAQLDPTGANKLVQRVLTTYRSSLARLLAQLAQARAAADAPTLRLVAHTLKSSSASVGALTLSGLCADAEKRLREAQHDGLPALLDHLVAEAERVDAAVIHLLTDA